MSSHRHKVLSKLCPGDCTTEWQETLRREHVDQIGDWFLEESCTKRWMNGSGVQVLWAHGPSSTGKTFISSQVASHIRSHHSRGDTLQATVIYSFHPHARQLNLADFGFSLCSIARQLATQLPESATGVLAQLDEISDFYPLSNEKSAKAFHEIVSTFDHTFIILDGINASENAIIATLDLLRGDFSRQRNLHVLFTSQEPPPSNNANTYDILPVKIEAAKEDLQRYIIHESGLDNSDIVTFGDRDGLQGALTDIMRITGSRFPPLPLHKNMNPAALLVTLSNVYENVSVIPDLDNRITALCKLTTLQAEKIHGLLAHRVLHLIARLHMLRGPVTAAAITNVLKTLGVTQVDGSFYTVSDIIESCSGLIVVSHKDREMRIKSPLLHLHLSEGISEGPHYSDLVQASFKYFYDEDFRSGPCKSAASLLQRFQKHPFLPCAARILSVYTCLVPNPESIFDDFLEVASNPKLLETYFQAANAWSYRDKASYTELEDSEERYNYITRGYTPLHFAVHLVCKRYFIDRLLQRGDDIGARTANGETALHIAAEIGDYSDIVRVLLDNGADVSAVEEAGETPLSRAVVLGDLDTVRTLIVYGACVDDLCEEVLSECAASQPEIAKYLAGIGVQFPEVDTEEEGE